MANNKLTNTWNGKPQKTAPSNEEPKILRPIPRRISPNAIKQIEKDAQRITTQSNHHVTKQPLVNRQVGQTSSLYTKLLEQIDNIEDKKLSPAIRIVSAFSVSQAYMFGQGGVYNYDKAVAYMARARQLFAESYSLFYSNGVTLDSLLTFFITNPQNYQVELATLTNYLESRDCSKIFNHAEALKEHLHTIATLFTFQKTNQLKNSLKKENEKAISDIIQNYQAVASKGDLITSLVLRIIYTNGFTGTAPKFELARYYDNLFHSYYFTIHGTYRTYDTQLMNLQRASWPGVRDFKDIK